MAPRKHRMKQIHGMIWNDPANIPETTQGPFLFQYCTIIVKNLIFVVTRILIHNDKDVFKRTP